MRICALFILAISWGCAHRDQAGLDGDPTPLTCDEIECTDVPSRTCVGGRLRTYEAACTDATCSYPATETACGDLGCCGDHCCALVPSNADVFGELAPEGPGIAPPNGTFDTSTECTPASVLGACTVESRGADLGEACVCRMGALTVGTLRITGARALVLFATRTVTIQTLLAVDASGATSGPGASRVYASPPAQHFYGGAGGSYGTAGGWSGSIGTGPAAAVYGSQSLVPLLGGMRGGGHGSDREGGAGGAVQITAGESISVMGTVEAGGGGGGPGEAGSGGGGGGGSGGGILLEAPTVAVPGVLAAHGGGGGGGGGRGNGVGSGGRGFDALAAHGGDDGQGNDGWGCALFGFVSGGDGGRGATGDGGGHAGQMDDRITGCLFGDAFVARGGGGGGSGRIRINTRTGCQCSGTFGPSASFGVVVVE